MTDESVNKPLVLLCSAGREVGKSAVRDFLLKLDYYGIEQRLLTQGYAVPQVEPFTVRKRDVGTFAAMFGAPAKTFVPVHRTKRRTKRGKK